MGCHFLLQGIFRIQDCILASWASCFGRWVLYHYTTRKPQLKDAWAPKVEIQFWLLLWSEVSPWFFLSQDYKNSPIVLTCTQNSEILMLADFQKCFSLDESGTFCRYLYWSKLKQLSVAGLAAGLAGLIPSTGSRLVEIKQRVDPCLVHYCFIQETSISRVFWSSPQIETGADISSPPILPGKTIFMARSQQHHASDGDREKVMIHILRSGTLKDCRAQGVVKPPHSQSLLAATGKHHSQHSGENHVTLQWRQGGSSNSSVAVCVCL